MRIWNVHQDWLIMHQKYQYQWTLESSSSLSNLSTLIASHRFFRRQVHTIRHRNILVAMISMATADTRYISEIINGAGCVLHCHVGS